MKETARFAIAYLYNGSQDTLQIPAEKGKDLNQKSIHSAPSSSMVLYNKGKPTCPLPLHNQKKPFIYLILENKKELQ